MARPPLPPPALDPTPLASGLYLVSTPIGNLRDVTLRALDVLGGCDLILAEDTRVTAKLLSAFGLRKRVERCDDHTTAQAAPRILALIGQGGRAALVSDAGTPLVSDPGYRLVRAVLEAGLPVWPIPGPTAAIAALTVAGLPTSAFLFAGFPPPRTAARKRFFEKLAAVEATVIFYEGGSRLAAALADLAEVFGPRPAAVCRELTKLHETVARGPLDVLARDPAFAEPKGEVVIVVGPPAQTIAAPADADRALSEALTRLAPGEAASEVSRALGLPRRDLYRRALDLKAAS